MRTRWQFILGLFGIGVVAKAQSGTVSTSRFVKVDPFVKLQRPMTVEIEGRRLEWISDGKAKNNQCPVCGTMAPTFHRATVHEHDGYESVGGDLIRETNPREVPTGPTINVIRCARCNCAFWQDAE